MTTKPMLAPPATTSTSAMSRIATAIIPPTRLAGAYDPGVVARASGVARHRHNGSARPPTCYLRDSLLTSKPEGCPTYASVSTALLTEARGRYREARGYSRRRCHPAEVGPCQVCSGRSDLPARQPAPAPD